ncbi:outer membrane protein assembly factor BamB [Symbiobacterium terraclitae]|uniref:Outer membrane protein assembly factor BamB n=1 Tax=Symbiobacterium terraclitae TaxID=557451 RepID=A0ABS4JX84_9FIRM|nr:outer membrane protein assembly factor BamB [Symbiobacterium terraclitae]
MVQGLDGPDGSPRWQSYEAPTHKQDESGFGGFITPSAVIAPPHGENPSFVIGTDGFEGGRAIRLALDRNNDYRPYQVWTVDGPGGFAGNFTSDGVSAYWLDTRGYLWGATLARGREPDGWSGYSIDLPALIGAKVAFTNTEPAVEVRQTPAGPETHLYVTLRNYSDIGAGLRDGPTGNDGAVVALGPGGTLKWFHKFGPPDRHGGRKASMNTAPLALVSRGALLFGDVNGYFYSYALDTGNLTGGDARGALVQPDGRAPADRLFLLKEGEEPNTGPYNFSQVSGVGVDPAFGHGLLLVGVNYVRDGSATGRLVAYRAGEAYDLRWLDQPEPLVLAHGEPAALEPRLQLELTTRTLAAVCQGPVAVQWFLTDAAGQLVRPLGDVPLPGNLAPQKPHPVPLTVSLAEGDPAEGQIVGVIDLPTVYALGADHAENGALAVARGLAAALGLLREKSCAGAVAEVVEREGQPGPDGGLANNVLIVPYTGPELTGEKEGEPEPEPEPPVDDPSVVELAVPQEVEADQPFQVGIYLGYRNNLGRSEIRVPLRVWARPAAGGPAPAGGWQQVTIDQLPCCTFKPGTIPGLGAGVWEIIAEIDYAGDTRPENNRAVRRVEVLRLQSGGGTGAEGGAITD